MNQRQDIEDLQTKVYELRDVYRETLDKSTTLSALKSFNVTDKFELNRDDASYTLSISCDVPIDYVLLQCNVPVDLLEGHTNTAVSSYSDCDESVGFFCIFTAPQSVGFKWQRPQFTCLLSQIFDEYAYQAVHKFHSWVKINSPICLFIQGRKLSAHNISLSSEHNSSWHKNTDDRRSAWHLTGLRDLTHSAEKQHFKTVHNQATVIAPTVPRDRREPTDKQTTNNW